MNTCQNLEALKNPTSKDFFVLDIDSTLVTTFQRNQVILDSFITINENLFPEDCHSLKQASCQLGDYGLETSLIRINFTPSKKEVQTQLAQYWRENFFSNQFLHSDQPVKGATQWTQKLAQSEIDFIFLTARHKEAMWEGTLSSLAEMGFPISKDNLYLKEDLSHSDESYKSQLLGSLLKEKTDKDVWFIDNEPVVLNQILKDHPKVNLVWFESTHSGKMSPPEGVTTINNFNF